MKWTRRSLLLAGIAAAALSTRPAEAFLTSTQGAGGGGASTLTLAEFDQDRIFQRAAGGTTKNVPISGSYTGSPTGIQAQVTIVGGGTALAYVTCTNYVASNGNWTATIPAVPQGAWYIATVRDLTNNSITAAQTIQWGVGVLIALLGQSNMQKMWTRTNFNASVDQYARVCAGSGWWAPNKSLTGTGGQSGGGGGNVTLSTNLRTALGGTIPLGLLCYAIGGTSITTWQTGQSSWTAFIDASTGVNCAQIGGDFEFVLWHQGETDADNSHSPGSYYATDLAAVYTQAQSQTGRNTTTLKFGVAIVGTVTSGLYSDANMNTIRAAQKTQSAATGCFFAGSSVDMVHFPSDNLHWGDTQYRQMGARYANAVAKVLGLVAQNSLGPTIATAVWPVGSATLTITPTQNSGGTTLKDGAGSASGTGILGFTVSSSGGQTVSSVALSSGTIVVTMSGNRGGGDTVTMTHGEGLNPWGWVTSDGGSDAHLTYDDQSAYLGTTIGFPLESSFGSITVTT